MSVFRQPIIADATGISATRRDSSDEQASGGDQHIISSAQRTFSLSRSPFTAMFASSARSAALSAGLGRRAASTIAQKYSNAIFSAALNKSPQVLTKVQTELNAIQSAVKATPELASFIHNPTLSTKDRAAGLPSLYAAAGKDGVSEITKNLFVVLSENGRLVETEGVIEGFNELVANYRGELNVTITSATPLPKDVQTRLETLLKQSQAAQQAKSLKITNKVCGESFACLLAIYERCEGQPVRPWWCRGRLWRQDDRPQRRVAR